MFKIVRQLLVYAIIDNTWHKCVEWFYKRQEVTTTWEAQDLVFSQMITKLIKHHDDNERTTTRLEHKQL
jgi:hypothetical protein